ncbi:hypothetical protein FGG08_000118 [Glutinoglossum americanum]|uniref:Transport protein particle subunit trs85-2 n=1 Tax=Glutinoglossum americanum TaxID=1670608 RepID=A0A9P8IDP3_9PEZI|nr:hypothetical protein FGG08_000118 [Glutinoglossum americanum]
MPKTRSPLYLQAPSASLSSLSNKPSNASLSSLFASTSSPPTSRSISPSGESPAGGMVASHVFSSITTPGASPRVSNESKLDEVKELILRAFVPHIAIHASADTNEIANEKGFRGGFRELLRPFGDLVQGKVTVRDSIGASRTWEDFGVRFVGLGGSSSNSQAMGQGTARLEMGANGLPGDTANAQTPRSTLGIRPEGDIDQIEELVHRHLSHAEAVSGGYVANCFDYKGSVNQSVMSTSPFYALYLRRLLSGLPMTPHETFAHPVACIIAISSRNKSPIETLRQLYESGSRGEKRLPLWVNSEYLRYYVLVHDEEKDDIAQSTALFDQMKRHFGLHCHLLRLRSSQCVPTDDDSVRMPLSEWTTAAEDLSEIRSREAYEDMEVPTPCLFESDSTAIRTFVREMVTQSVVPFMERCVTTWNDQVASRRRGISGRFMSLSKRWTSFGTSSRTSSGPGLTGSSGTSSSNYDPLQGCYRRDAPEAMMRKLGDYAFMLRDWKLSQGIYELLRSDFSNDKAWKYHAGAHEMTAISTLLNQQTLSSKVRSETVDQMLETASYSYITRCAEPYGALRCLSVAIELLRLRGGSAADDAARWCSRLLDMRVLGATGQALFTERVSTCYAARKGAGSGRWGSRRRKSALWNILAADAWLKLGKNVQAEKCLDEATQIYNEIRPQKSNALAFDGMQTFMDDLRHALRANIVAIRGIDGLGDRLDGGGSPAVEEESEKLDNRRHRGSLIGGGVSPFGGLDAGPLSPMHMSHDEPMRKDDNFE